MTWDKLLETESITFTKPRLERGDKEKIMLNAKEVEYLVRTVFILVHRETAEVEVLGREECEHKYLASLPRLFREGEKIVLTGCSSPAGVVLCRAAELPMGFAVIAITHPSSRGEVTTTMAQRAVDDYCDYSDL